jgi:hypothetical protein
VAGADRASAHSIVAIIVTRVISRVSSEGTTEAQ